MSFVFTHKLDPTVTECDALQRPKQQASVWANRLQAWLPEDPRSICVCSSGLRVKGLLGSKLGFGNHLFLPLLLKRGLAYVGLAHVRPRLMHDDRDPKLEPSAISGNHSLLSHRPLAP